MSVATSGVIGGPSAVPKSQQGVCFTDWQLRPKSAMTGHWNFVLCNNLTIIIVTTPVLKALLHKLKIPEYLGIS